ncbi:M14-type cytosolic carboxypeptidase [Omnitrophica bacterium]|nr:M14-type cytosolic carboxypeptidase [Candidatus Omnitrophota bacterium]
MKTRRKKCKRKNKSKRIDAGYYDKYRGWYDVQGCGKCYDYCRWVGNSGPGGNPKHKTIKKMKGKSKSWWSCRLANKKGRYSTRKKWKKGFNYKKCVREGQVTRLPLQGNKSMFGGGLFKGKSTISTNFESGNINHIKNVQRKKDVLVVLEIENEPYPKNTKRKYQNWFYFKSNDVQRKSMTYTIRNINIFGNDWKGFNVCYSYDNKNWKRIKTSFSKKNKTLTWKHRSTKKNVYFAYYPPYTTVMKQKMMMKYKNKKGVKAKTLGKSKVDALILGNGPLKIFIVARQHPGESIGSWMIEGFLKEYFSDVQRKVVEDVFTFYIIPMANPDGVKLGHWYTNKKGQNLNRSWRHNKTSETNAIKKLMTEKKALLYLDLHGDEGASKHFITSCIESKNKVRKPFNNTMAKFCPNFQKEDYYKRHAHKVYGTMDCFDKERTLTIEGAMKHSLYKHKTIQDEGIKIGKAIYKTVISMQDHICIDN